MTAHPPPVPPANRSGTANDQRPTERQTESAQTRRKPQEEQPERQSAIKQNTTHPGYQQDR